MATAMFTEGEPQEPSPIPNGNQLLPNIVDRMAKSRPETLYARIPNSFTSYSAGYRNVTYHELANAVNGVAWLLQEQLGKGNHDQTIAYFGPNDIGYVVAILGASKAGYTILCPSPRLISAHVVHLLKVNKCSTIMTLQPPFAPGVQSLLDTSVHQIHVVHVPTVYDLLDGKYQHFPYPYTYEAIKNQPLVIVHSSGTTGVPKNVTYTHAVGCAWINQMLDLPPEGYQNASSMTYGNSVFTAFPFFHSGGLMFSLFWALAVSTTMTIPLAGIPPTADTIIQGLELVSVDAVLIPTPFLELIVQNPSHLSSLARCTRTVAFSGADLSNAAGAALSTTDLRVVNYFASTEAMMHPTVHVLPSATTEPVEGALHYIQPHPRLNAHFDPQTDDGLCELVLRRNPAPRLQPVFLLQPELSDEFRTHDLFRAHRNDARLWRFDGRSDDLIASATGELCNPVAFEQLVCSITGVGAALVVGAGRWKKVLLVEPVAAAAPVVAKDFVDGIWPEIEAANAALTQNSRIARSHVVVTDPAKPMLRAGKGTVQRAPTLTLYAPQIDELYRINGDGQDGQEQPIPVHVSFNR